MHGFGSGVGRVIPPAAVLHVWRLRTTVFVETESLGRNLAETETECTVIEWSQTDSAGGNCDVGV